MCLTAHGRICSVCSTLQHKVILGVNYKCQNIDYDVSGAQKSKAWSVLPLIFLFLDPLILKCGLLIGSDGNIWKSVRSVESQAPLRPTEADSANNKIPRCMLMFENH